MKKRLKKNLPLIALALLMGVAMVDETEAQFATRDLLTQSPTTQAIQTNNALTSLSLDSVIDQFLKRSLSVEAARYRVEIARAEQIAASLRPNPTINISFENFKISGDTPFNRLYETAITYAQTIELGGKRRLRQEVADLGISVAEAQLADVLRQRMFEVKTAYYDAVLANMTYEGAIENRDNFNELLKFNQIRFEEGDISEGELLKVKLERIKFDSAVSQARLARRQAGIRILELLNETDFSPAENVIGEIKFVQFKLDLVGLREQALRNRPDLLAAEQLTKQAERRIALEKARNSTDITPFAGVKRVGVDNTVLFGVTIPLRINDRNQGGIAKSVAEEKVAQTEMVIIRNHALAEVESAYRAYETAQAQVMTFERELVPQANESRNIALAAYREGATDLLPLLEAQRTNADIRYQYFRSLYEYQVSILRLESAIGGEIKP